MVICLIWCVCVCVSAVCTNSHSSSSSRTEVSSQSAPSTPMKTQTSSSDPQENEDLFTDQQSVLAALRWNIFGVLVPKHLQDQAGEAVSVVFRWYYNFMKFLCAVLCFLSCVFPVFVCLFTFIYIHVHSFLASPQNQVSFLLLHLRARPWASSRKRLPSFLSQCFCGWSHLCVSSTACSHNHTFSKHITVIKQTKKKPQLSIPVIGPVVIYRLG